jgi:phage shock protein PspC (stress-responsive transcriptional regulator)
MDTSEDTTQIQQEPRRLTRSRDRVLGGVGGGLGRYFGVDPIILRIGLVALAVFGGAGIFVYLAALLFVPVEGSQRPAVGVRLFRGDRGILRRVALVTAVIVGSGLLAVSSAWATGTGSGEIVAGVVILVGIALVVAAFRGGARWLILPALAVALPACVVAAADVDFHGGVGERSYRPQTVEQIQDSYQLGIGHLKVDLRGVRFPPGDQPLELKAGTGAIELLVPKDVCVTTKARIGAGYVGALDRENGGVDVDWDDNATSQTGAPRLVVDGDVGLGALLISERPVGDDSSFSNGENGTNSACLAPAT